MPLIDIYIPSGALNQEQQDELANALLQSLMHCDHAIGNPRAQSINWVYVHEHPAEKLYVAGQARAKPHYRIEVTVMEGMMSQEVKELVARDMTQSVLQVEGTADNPMNASRIWVLFHDMPEGSWASAGRVYRLQDLMNYISKA